MKVAEEGVTPIEATDTPRNGLVEPTGDVSTAAGVFREVFLVTRGFFLLRALELRCGSGGTSSHVITSRRALWVSPTAVVLTADLQPTRRY